MFPLLELYLDRAIHTGALSVTDASGTTRTWGDGTGTAVHLRFNSRASERAVALDPALRLGECYMDGQVDLIEGSTFDLVRLVMENAGVEATGQVWMRLAEHVRRISRQLVESNSPRRSRHNVEHHYDLSHEFFSLFLDADRQYSCAYFETPDATLEEAQLAKKRHLASKMAMDADDLRVLDIGCGWGGLGLYLARNCRARVTGVTLSSQQQTVARERAEAAGLAERARFELQDYRTAKGCFDRIVSVGMFEHVGLRHYTEYFRRCADLLDEDGIMVLHSIGQSDVPAATNGFLAKYIFPGGYIPSLSQVLLAAENAGLIVTDVEVLRLHYAETLRHWRGRFQTNRERARALYDERFCRMWEFYLAISEGSFRWQNMMVFQLQLARRSDVLPTTRTYLF
ncbi:cyclopropane-fatty-acyl-phospholipid synthase family protein [Consotaella aegiceratis]|uniref:cyclopropane-fatty-acyl-phospholipid synthase family protein n=1 Tax=Consotaella aegiceratis TaxID=3097961 RepID=UPI002F4094BF